MSRKTGRNTNMGAGDTRRSVLSGLRSLRLAFLPCNEIIKQSRPRLHSHTDVTNQSINLEVEE